MYNQAEVEGENENTTKYGFSYYGEGCWKKYLWMKKFVGGMMVWNIEFNMEKEKQEMVYNDTWLVNFMFKIFKKQYKIWINQNQNVQIDQTRNLISFHVIISKHEALLHLINELANLVVQNYVKFTELK